MRLLIFIVLLIGFSTFSQESTRKTIISQEGDVIKYVEYHENGLIAQTGYIKDGLNHGSWSAYNPNGNKIAEGQYQNGKRTSKWFFWDETTLVEVDFKDNKVVKAIRWDKNKVLADNVEILL